MFDQQVCVILTIFSFHIFALVRVRLFGAIRALTQKEDLIPLWKLDSDLNDPESKQEKRLVRREEIWLHASDFVFS